MSQEGRTLEQLAEDWRAAGRQAEQARVALRRAVWQAMHDGGTTRPLARRIGLSAECVRLWAGQPQPDLEAEALEVDGQLQLLDA